MEILAKHYVVEMPNGEKWSLPVNASLIYMIHRARGSDGMNRPPKPVPPPPRISPPINRGLETVIKWIKKKLELRRQKKEDDGFFWAMGELTSDGSDENIRYITEFIYCTEKIGYFERGALKAIDQFSKLKTYTENRKREINNPSEKVTEQQPDTRKYFNWDRSALLDECIKQAHQLYEIRNHASRIIQIDEIPYVNWEAINKLQKLLKKD